MIPALWAASGAAGAPGPASAWLYHRLNFFGPLAAAQVREVGFFATASGARLIPPESSFGTAQLSFPVVNAFDNDPATQWRSGAENLPGGFVGALNATAQPIGKVTVLPHADNLWYRSFVVEGSNDDVTWDMVWVEPYAEALTITAGVELEYIPGAGKVPGQWLRLLLDANHGNSHVALSGVEFLDSSDAPVPVGIAAGSARFSNVFFENLIDSVTTNAWAANISALPELRFLTTGTTPAAKIRLTFRDPYGTVVAKSPRNFRVERSTDNRVTWTEVLARTDEAIWAVAEARTYSFT